MDSKSKLEAQLSKKMFIDITYELNYLQDNTDPEHGFICNKESNFEFDSCLYKKTEDAIMEKYEI